MDGTNKKQWGCASFLLVFGLLLLLINLGILQFNGGLVTSLIIPVLFLTIGIVNLIKFITRRKGIFLGLIFTVYGGLLTVSYLSEEMSFGYNGIWKLWPLLLVAFALSMLSKKSSIEVRYGNNRFGGDHASFKTAAESITRTSMKHAMSIGNEAFTSENWALENMKLNKSVGNYVFDLKKAYISEGETLLDVTVRIGNIKMLVPEELSVDITSKVAVGENTMFERRTEGTNERPLAYQSADFNEAPKRVKIILDVNVGSVRIDRI
ncbi:cell wall-active antibiotics response protein LiaF [Jeotgalibacillus terrae]|uniref:Cell wall-active antibiotics response protein LiaF n=1 Tax=Jeotgalibacillus terrae TaxID=587735 RepID=A0ABW5ZFZ2_9BACL|nr:cell wall-active antibiotics response protein LiaF [Jeotgalibacillus terrae]MBM7579817.1 lia operon protein LiaF [Jeotgalibacillus terrae]